jgi:hypothetical protein
MKNKSFIKEAEFMTLDPNMKVPVNPAPKKMAKAKATLEMVALTQKKRRKISELTSIQAELINVFAINPSEQQMQQLKDFLHQLFGEQLNQAKKEAKMVA